MCFLSKIFKKRLEYLRIPKLAHASLNILEFNAKDRLLNQLKTFIEYKKIKYAVLC